MCDLLSCCLPPLVPALWLGQTDLTRPDRRLDRLVEFDERSRSYPVRTLVAGNPPRSYTWSCGTYLDQRREGACVGFAWAHELAARPTVIAGMTEQRALEFYRTAQRLDPWPGEEYSGTSVLAGAKAVQAERYLVEYRWAFGLSDVVLTLGYKGPVVLGIPWYEGMFDPDPAGLVHVQGDVAGGHAILARGVSVKSRTVLLHNSWGPDWGVNGTARISFADLERLLYEHGEACVPTMRAAGTI